MKRIPVIIFGVGGVGRALIRQIVAGRGRTAERGGYRLDVVALVDSRSWLWRPAGLSDERLNEAITDKRNRSPVGEDERPDSGAVIQEAERQGLNRALVIDVTAAGGMEPVLDQALDLDYGVVLANKKPLAGAWQQAKRYFDNPLVRYESTVGGGQPVIATLRYLLDTGDPIRRIEGQLSGTLSYICRRLEDGTSFSVALAAAKAQGYTEPDPREDLGGRDVMRKLMILGRTAGWPVEPDDIGVEALYPSALAHLSRDEFMLASIALDPAIRDRVNAAGAAGEVLRYVAELEEGKGMVAMKPVPMESPLANLKYTGFYTARYTDGPLLIAGKGTGPEMTAAGVLGDVVALIREEM